MTNDKMTDEEREIAARVVQDALNVCETLKRVHEDCEELILKHGWDVNTWEIAEASADVGRIALEIAHAIGVDDGWAKEVAL